MTRKLKIQNRGYLKNKLDSVFSKFIRQRDGRCVTCTNPKGLPLTNGHLFSRVALSTRWNELNSHCQCTGCNLYHEHDAGRYTAWFLEKYGQAAYKELYYKYSRIAKFTNPALLAMIQEYEKKLERP